MSGSIMIELADEAASEALASSLAMLMRRGDLVRIEGDLGAGKTTMARAMLRVLADDPELEVPSPTFTLVQIYDLRTVRAIHVDLYRIDEPSGLDELGLEDELQTGVMIVEWPDKAGDRLPMTGLTIQLEENDTGRLAVLTPLDEDWQERLQRYREIENLLNRAGWSNATRHRLPADASSRRYERLSNGPYGHAALLMDMPSRGDGPPVRNGLPYSRIAHLAEDIRAVAAINQGLQDKGLSAPSILAIDMDAGLAVIEDFGGSTYGAMLSAGKNIEPCLKAAVTMLAHMAGRDWPKEVQLASCGETYQLQSYDLQALLIEAELCLDWYWPHVRNDGVPEEVRTRFIQLWTKALSPLGEGKQVWTLRDFHVDNLFWLPERDGNQVVGLIDTQDCVLGDPAYDLASLLQDVRVRFDRDLTDALFEAYISLRHQQDETFDRASFEATYALLGAQRATKILGIFARLNKRDGKPHYLGHLPRTSEVLEENLRHPALADLRTWFDEYLPAHLRTGSKP